MSLTEEQFERRVEMQQWNQLPPFEVWAPNRDVPMYRKIVVSCPTLEAAENAFRLLSGRAARPR